MMLDKIMDGVEVRMTPCSRADFADYFAINDFFIPNLSRQTSQPARMPANADTIYDTIAVHAG